MTTESPLPRVAQEKSVLALLQDHARPIVPIVGQDVRYRLKERLSYHRCPALSLAIVRSGKIAEAAAYGHADPQTARLANDETLFQAASMSKPLAAILALQFVREGLLGLDDDVRRYLNSWSLPENPNGCAVTLRHLLSHRSGATTVRFPNHLPDAPRPSTIDMLEGRPPALNGPLTFEGAPGECERYSNTGYTLIQLLIEDISGKPFAEVARTRLFDTLGLTRSTFAQPLTEVERQNASIGIERGQPMEGIWRYQPQLAAAGLWTTPSEYARILLAFRDAALGRDSTLLDETTARAMLKPQGGEFGLGWMLREQPGNLRFGHTGSNFGFRSAASICLESGEGVVAMANADTGRHVYLEAIHGIARICDWSDLIPSPVSIVRISSNEFALFEGVYHLKGLIAPPLALVAKSDHLLYSRPGTASPPERMLMGENGRLFCTDSIFSLKALGPPDEPVQELAVFEIDKGEVARAVRE
jgi:CubicO group peptidase (beta-lactamase class C family)